MSVVRYFTPENRLAKIITAPGGKRVETAILDAEEQLGEISGSCLAQIDKTLDRIYRWSAQVPVGEALIEFYRDTRDLAGLAAIGGLPDLGTAALSFCALLDHAQSGGRLNVEYLGVYIGVFRILRHTEQFDEALSANVLDHLATMVETISKKEGFALEGL
jgi:hypothetical protein